MSNFKIIQVKTDLPNRKYYFAAPHNILEIADGVLLAGVTSNASKAYIYDETYKTDDVSDYIPDELLPAKFVGLKIEVEED